MIDAEKRKQGFTEKKELTCTTRKMLHAHIQLMRFTEISTTKVPCATGFATINEESL
jgi:hypothetical protein